MIPLTTVPPRCPTYHRVGKDEQRCANRSVAYITYDGKVLPNGHACGPCADRLLPELRVYSPYHAWSTLPLNYGWVDMRSPVEHRLKFPTRREIEVAYPDPDPAPIPAPIHNNNCPHCEVTGMYIQNDDDQGWVNRRGALLEETK